MTTAIQSFCFTQKGKREKNEDCIYPSINEATNTNNLFLVCDGMGGHKKGEVASALACTIITSYLQSATANNYEQKINEAFKNTLLQLDAFAKENDAAGMGTTVTLFWKLSHQIILAHIGDSRIYQVRDNQILHQTKDHSLVQKLIAEDLITVEEARHHPKKNIITKALVAGAPIFLPDIKLIENFKPNDYFFLCTDGVIESMTNEDLLEILSQNISNKEKIDKIELACSLNSRDNFSAYLIQIT